MLTQGMPGVSKNPLVESPYFQHVNLGTTSTPPPPSDAFLLLDGSNFELLSGDEFTLLE